jgi:predicted DNA-binding ribbon-helix-helix protein
VLTRCKCGDIVHHMSTRQTVTLTTPQSDFLKRLAKVKGITVSDLIRRIIDEYRESKK